jgi:hypothetical protein
VALTDLQTRKLEHLFRVNDRDGDGFITEADIAPTAELFAQARGWAADEARPSAHRQLLAGVWQSYRAASDPADGGRMSLAAWMRLYGGYLTAMRAELDAGGHALLDQFEQSIEHVFGMLDEADAGYAPKAVWCDFARAMNVADPEAAFARLDTQGRGYLLRAEIVQLQADFLLSDDPAAPGNHYFGVLDG